MPNKSTFNVKPIRDWVMKFFESGLWVDPFVGHNPFKQDLLTCNDMNPEVPAVHHMDAVRFLQLVPDDSVAGVFFDPPYSLRQVVEVYGGVGRKRKPASVCYDEIARVLRPGGLCLSFGWNSNGAGKSRGFELLDLLLVAHGAHHNDTICVCERLIE